MTDWSNVQSPLDREKAAYRPLISIDELIGLEREGHSIGNTDVIEKEG